MMDPLKRHVTYVTWVAPLRAPIEPSHSCSSQLLLSLIFVISFLLEFFFLGGGHFKVNFHTFWYNFGITNINVQHRNKNAPLPQRPRTFRPKHSFCVY